jgi:ABC-type Fe3+/spermidine/putrescine transport system ATPase subunit
MSYIKIDNVVKDYGTFVALRGISLDVNEGEFVSLLGPSGCGKTSLLRAIAGLEDIQGGSITVGDRVLSQKGSTVPPERRNVGLIFQSYALWPHMTVYKNIAYGLKLHKWDANRIADRVREVLAVVGLEGMEDRLPSQLSGGQMQRVAVARSIAAAPGVLLFDEPLSNLDAKLRETMRFELRRIQKAVGTTAVYVTHDQAEALVISDRIVLMNAGRIVQQGTARELYETPESEFAAKFVGFSNLIPAVVESTGGARAVAGYRVDGAGSPLVPGKARADVARGEKVMLSVRPESIRVERHGAVITNDAVAALPATVKEIVYAGNLCDVFLDVDEYSVRAQVNPYSVEGFAAGDRVSAVFDARSVWPVPRDPDSASTAVEDAA